MSNLPPGGEGATCAVKRVIPPSRREWLASHSLQPKLGIFWLRKKGGTVRREGSNSSRWDDRNLVYFSLDLSNLPSMQPLLAVTWTGLTWLVQYLAYHWSYINQNNANCNNRKYIGTYLRNNQVAILRDKPAHSLLVTMVCQVLDNCYFSNPNREQN